MHTCAAETTSPSMVTACRVRLALAATELLMYSNHAVNFFLYCTTFDFDCEYLWKDSRHPKSERNMIDSDYSRVPRKKSGELWSTNKKVLLANFEPLSINFFLYCAAGERFRRQLCLLCRCHGGVPDGRRPTQIDLTVNERPTPQSARQPV